MNLSFQTPVNRCISLRKVENDKPLVGGILFNMNKITSLKWETWRIVVGWPNYSVSSLGRVKSLRRQDSFGNIHENEILLSLKPDSNGYIKVKLYKSNSDVGRIKVFGVHQLVCLCFKTKKKAEVEIHHKDGDKSNNNRTNLRWVTRKKHLEITRMETAFGHGHSKGQLHPMSKLNNDLVSKIRKDYSDGAKQKVLAETYRVSRMTIFRIIKNKSWNFQQSQIFPM